MVTGMLPFRPAVVIRAGVEVRKSGQIARKTTPYPKWWAPLFGFSPEPDYIIISEIRPAVQGEPKPGKFRFESVAFTEEKARRLRRMTNDATSFHDSMYHSAVASRLASDFSDRAAAP